MLGFECGGRLKEEPIYNEMYVPTIGNYFDDDFLVRTNISLSDFSKIASKLRTNEKEPRFIEGIKSIKDKRSIIWCIRNAEQELYKNHLKDSVIIDGSTPIEKRVSLINDFKSGNIQYLISKPKVLGFGVNIQEAESHLYSGYNFSFQEKYQAIRRSHRYGRKGRLVVNIPIADVELPVYNTLKKKLNTFQNDIKKLQKKFKMK
jgi:superfamily II DNA or RNA helicase